VPARVDARQRALFAPERIAPASSAVARLRALAATAPPRAGRPRSSRDEDAAMVEKLRGMAAQLAAHFGLRYSAVDAEAAGVVAHYGICYADGRIRIRLRHATTGRILKESSLVDTLCHELAHLKHFDHSLRFRRFHERVLDEARRRGWYRPGPRRSEPPPMTLWEIAR
jgi:predicted metal-dependent hydrolase